MANIRFDLLKQLVALFACPYQLRPKIRIRPCRERGATLKASGSHFRAARIQTRLAGPVECRREMICSSIDVQQLFFAGHKGNLKSRWTCPNT